MILLLAISNNMTRKNNLKMLLAFSFPPMISMLIQALYNIVDSIYVARISDDAITAISFAMPIQNLILAVAVGTGVGVNSYIARKIGENDYKSVERAIFQGFLLAVLSALIFIGLGVWLLPSFFGLFTNDSNILNMCYDYTYIVVFFGIFQLLHILIEKIFQANGKMIFPMIMQAVGAIINIILDPIFIFTLGMGIKGAAIATIIGQGSAMLLSFIFLLITKFNFKLDIREFRVSPKIIKEIYSVGVPTMLMTALTSFLVIVLNDILKDYSNTAVNVYGLYFKLQTFVFMPVSGLTQGAMPILGYSYGAKMRNSLKTTLNNSLKVGSGIMLFGLLLFQIFPKQLLLIFSDNSELLKIGIPALRIISISFVPAAFAMIIPTLFQAMGKGKYSLLVFSLRQFILVLPLAYLFSYLFSLTSIWYVFLIAESISAVVSLYLLRYTMHHDEVFLERNIL